MKSEIRVRITHEYNPFFGRAGVFVGHENFGPLGVCMALVRLDPAPGVRPGQIAAVWPDGFEVLAQAPTSR